MKFTLIHKATVNESVNRRAGGFYHIMFHDDAGTNIGNLTIQGNPFGSCGINLLSGWGSLWQQPPIKYIPDFFEFLRKFGDGIENGNTEGGSQFKARRYLLQVTANQLHNTFLKEVLNHCTLLSEYNNLAHSSSKQFLYMLELK